MIIVSQDKRKIVNFDNLFNIDYYKIDGNFEIDANTENDSVCLGHYKTEERAKEVLQEIMKVYKFYNGKTYYVEDVYNLLGDYENGVYEMPVEGEKR